MQQAQHLSDWVTLDRTVELGRNLSTRISFTLRIGLGVIASSPKNRVKTVGLLGGCRSGGINAVRHPERRLPESRDQREAISSGRTGGLRRIAPRRSLHCARGLAAVG